MYNGLIKFTIFGIFFVTVIYIPTTSSVLADVTTCSSSKDGKSAICKVQGLDSTISSQYACTNQMNGTWNCVEITEKTKSAHLNTIKDTLKKLMDLKSQGHDAINNFGR
jgi:hypothetical protein